MATLKEAVLNYLDIETLKCILNDYELDDQADKRSPGDMRRALNEYGDLTVQSLLEYFYETDVKALCEQLDINSKGRKNALIERLIDACGIEQEVSSEEDEEDDELIKPEDAIRPSDLDAKEQDDGQDEVEVIENRISKPRPGRRSEVPPTPTGDYEFEPIQGYPMLNWRGKRPFRSTQFYPAQLKESHGPEFEGWRNRIYWGDNLQVMSHLLKEFRGKVDLVYIDPPFDSKAEYKKYVSVRGTKTLGDVSSFEEKQYTDIWSNDEYLQFMYERIILLKELLSEDGTFFIHCDWHKSHHLRCLLDEVFGATNFRNEIAWCYRGGGVPKTDYAPKHDTILRYSKTDNYYFDVDSVRIPYSEDVQNSSPSRYDKSYRANSVYGGYIPNEKGKHPEDWWEIQPIMPSDQTERAGYPTQKPEKLLERIISGSSKKNDLVFDCFMGSGTTQSVAMKLGRRFIGADINLGAVQTTTKRLLKVAAELDEKQAKLALETPQTANEDEPDDDKTAKPTVFYTGFEVYNVNHYDVFRNPVQAKKLLIEALEIRPLGPGSIYDGEKDGRMVKIMPVNRIATKADLNELTANFNWKGFERKQKTQRPNDPVEKILLVCMGHEPDLKAQLELAAKPFKIDVEVIDILRDKSNLEFKRDAEAEIGIEEGELIIRAFYPMNLLQKLSLMKEQVDDWRELVESIMVDWNYDGAVLEPAVVDLPGKNELVSGTYPVPPDAGTIRVKITDLLSESLEVEVAHV